MAVVQLAKRHQIGTERADPISLIDMWSPQHTVADRKRDAVAERAIFEAAQLRSDVSTVNAAVFICGKVKQRLEACELDKDWNKVFRSQLTGIEGVEPGNIELLVRYHTVLRKTSKGWTYARSVQEMVVMDPYHPKILASLRDCMSSSTELFCEKLDNYDPDDGHLEEGLAGIIKSDVDDFKQIGILQFFAQADCSDKLLRGPTSQGTIPLFINLDNPTHSFRPQEESDRLLNEKEFHGTLIQEVFTRTNSMMKLYELRPAELERQCFAEFICNYRHVKRGTEEYKRLLRLLTAEGGCLGPRSEKTMIAGTLEMAPMFMLLENDQMVRLRDKAQAQIMRLVANDQVLGDKMKVFLFGHWRRLEDALREEEPDIEQCDAVRLLLFPSSVHASE